MFNIDEFSKLSQVPVKTLHYYDESGLLRRAKVFARNAARIEVDVIAKMRKAVEVFEANAG